MDIHVCLYLMIVCKIRHLFKFKKKTLFWSLKFLCHYKEINVCSHILTILLLNTKGSLVKKKIYIYIYSLFCAAPSYQKTLGMFSVYILDHVSECILTAHLMKRW